MTAPAADVETASEGYAQRFAGPVGAWFLERQARLTLELLAPWPKARVVEVGGGHGQLTGPLVEAGHDVTVHGTAPSCGERVRSWVEAGRARFVVGPVDPLPWPDAAFDVVLAFRLLPHVETWPRLLAELARVARHAVIVDYPTVRSVNVVAESLFRAKKAVEGNTRPFLVFRDAEMEAALAARGFAVTARRPEFFLPMALHRAIGSAGVSRASEAVAGALGLRRLLGSPVILRAERRG